MNRIRILIADDHAHVRTQIRMRLSREDDFEIVAEAGNSSEVVEYGLAHAPHIVLIDPAMHDGLGVEAVRQLAARLPDTAIVVLTAYVDTALQMVLRKAGVCHILDKEVDSKPLLEVLRTVGQNSTTLKLKSRLSDRSPGSSV